MHESRVADFYHDPTHMHFFAQHVMDATPASHARFQRFHSGTKGTVSDERNTIFLRGRLVEV